MPKGEAVQILIPMEDRSFELNREALEHILLQDNVKNKNVVVISVAGSFRKGKSFLLSFFLRYLSAEDSRNWMGELEEPLAGFKWKASRDRVTTGIFMWSKPFLTRLPSGQEVAILLMDTQGTFDSKSTEKENSTIFALSTMLSSILIYNLSENLYEYDLLHLQRFAEYGKLALDTIEVPFQKLIFLIRDYPIADEWGAAGGKVLLEETMQAESEELQIVRDLIKASFSEQSCYLMPHPGKAVASKADFDGRLLDIDEDFRYYLKSFISGVLEPSNLVLKKISGNNVTAKNFIQYFSSYVKIFSSDIVPTPQNILLGVIECDNTVALTNVKDLYLKKMDELTESISASDELYDDEQKKKLKKSHEEIKAEVLNLFDSIKKTGGLKHSKKYRQKLIQYMDEQFDHMIKFLKSSKALRISVGQIEAMFRKHMDELYGINAPFRDTAEIEESFVFLVGEAVSMFYTRAAALPRAEAIIPVYKQKLDRAMESIHKFYIELNLEKSSMSSMVDNVLQEFNKKMETQLAEVSDSVNVFEFVQIQLQLRNEALKLFDVNKCSQIITAVYKEKLEKELQIIVANYEKINNQKADCEYYIEFVISVYKDDWHNNKEESMRKAKKMLERFVGRSPILQTYLVKLEEKLNKCWSYEKFVSSAKLIYKECMKNIINAKSGKITEEEADRQHAYSKTKAVDSLADAIKEMGEDEEYVGYAKQLDRELQYLYMYYKGMNESKGNGGCIIL